MQNNFTLDDYLGGLFEDEEEMYNNLNYSTNIPHSGFENHGCIETISVDEKNYLESLIQFKIDRKEYIMNKIESFYEYLMDLILNKSPIEVQVYDIQKSSVFNYDKGIFCLSENAKFMTWDLNNNSSQIAQTAYLLHYFYVKLLNCQISSKREIYYSNVDLFKSMQNLNRRIIDICYMFDFNRFDLELYPSEKGLFSGNLMISDSNGNLRYNRTKSGEKYLITHNLIYEDFFFESSAQFILVVEKDTVLSFLNRSFFV
jgi:DNA topoisomerase VI subunit A